MINSILLTITQIIQNQPIIAPLLILLAGVITSVTPCALASIPLIVGYMGMNVGMNEGEWNKKKGLKITLLYILGQIITFSIIGGLAGAIGVIMRRYMRYWYIFLGMLTLLLSFEVMGITNYVKSSGAKVNPKLTGYSGSFVMGITSGLFMSPCATPIMVLILGIVSQTGAVLKGVIYLMLYALGMGFLVLIAGTSTEKIYTIMNNPRYGIYSNILQSIMALVMLLAGFYFMYFGLR